MYQRLLAEDWIDPWLDEEKLLPGQDWDAEIRKAVEVADVMLVCLSSTSVSKEGRVQKEIEYVVNLALFKPHETIYVIPLRLDECALPSYLRSIQYVDYFPIDHRDWILNRLLMSLKVRLANLGISTRNTNLYKRLEENKKKIQSANTQHLDIFLVETGHKKNDVIKVIRQLASLELTDAKKISETLGERLLSNLDKDFAMQATTMFEKAGAIVSVVEAGATTKFSVVLRDIGARMIDVIKVVRRFANLELGDAVNLARRPDPIILTTFSKDFAMRAKLEFELEGATVDVITQ